MGGGSWPSSLSGLETERDQEAISRSSVSPELLRWPLDPLLLCFGLRLPSACQQGRQSEPVKTQVSPHAFQWLLS